MLRASSGPALALAALLALPACASTGAGTGDTATGETDIRIDNDLGDLVTVNVYVVSDTGRRDPLGNVASGAVETFRFSGDIGNYVLEAIRTDGRAVIRSDPFRIMRGATVRWRLNSNSVIVSRR